MYELMTLNASCPGVVSTFTVVLDVFWVGALSPTGYSALRPRLYPVLIKVNSIYSKGSCRHYIPTIIVR